jgi:hypothetical protein
MKITKMLIFPVIFYLIVFCVLTFPLIIFFHTYFFTDNSDGLQNIWNIWWVNKAITELHQNPWYTTYLCYPKGTSLLGHTLNPFNGFLGIPLLKMLTLTETHNLIVLFSFIMGGVTAFWLSFYITESYWSSLAAGYIFTFSQYHFMHAEGHLQLVSLEWIPLFILLFYRLLINPGIVTAIASAIVLFLVLLCDYYYFLYCVIAGMIIVVWYAFVKGEIFFFLKKRYVVAFCVFIGVSLITSGILGGSLFLQDIRDPLLGAHDPLDASLDLLAPFIPGAHWRFAQLTEFYWSRLRGDINETSVYVGLSVIILLCYAWYKRKDFSSKYHSFFLWYGMLFFFIAMALGPTLHIAGKPVFEGPMPYTVLQMLLPPLELSGCPVRMMVMVMLSAAVVSAMSLQNFFRKMNARYIFLAVILVFMMFIEFLPQFLPLTKVYVPEYVNVLRHLPKDGGLMDAVDPPFSLYYQTIHEIPIANGYIARYPTSVFDDLIKKYSAFLNQDYFSLYENYNIRYILIKNTSPVKMKTLYESNDALLFKTY